MGTKKNDHCRSPQRADVVSGVELVVGTLPISAVPDHMRDDAVLNVLKDESYAKRIMHKMLGTKESKLT